MNNAWRRTVIALLIVGSSAAVLLAFAQDQETLRVRTAVSAQDPQAIDYVAALVGSAVSRGNAYDVLTNGDEIFPAMLEAINAARTRVSFETYIFESGSVADQFTSAFEAAARRGVRVNLVVDFLGGSSMPDEHIERLERAGCQIASFNRSKWYTLEELNYRTHRKILVTDGEVAFVGGVGVADHWLGDAQDKDHWRDTQVRVRGPIASLLEGAFYENFIEAASLVTPEIRFGVPAEPEDDESLLVRSSPTGGSNDLKRLYLLAIGAARRSLDITTPYLVTDESTKWALKDAVKRGVKVRVVTEGDITDAKSVKYASRRSYEELMSAGIELYEYQPTMLHTKATVVDRIWSMFGSANLDNRSLELNDELNVLVSNPKLAGRLLEDFEADLLASKRLTLDEWRRRGLLEKTREHFWGYFSEIF
jgi:cardiolipin synthase A/B